MTVPHSDYLIFIDESGDHTLDFTNPQFPVFVLAACIIKKEEYINKLTPKFTELKLKYFHDDSIIFHERELHKRDKAFVILNNPEILNGFMKDLNDLMATIDYTVISVVINKEKLKEKYAKPFHVYYLALKFCMERIRYFLKEKKSYNFYTHVVFESRGKEEDSQLLPIFLSLANTDGWTNFSAAIISKITNSLGLQFVDLIARPIGRYAINPQQANRAFEILKNKINKNIRNDFNDCGLKIFP
jgi:hypothetical protein